MAAWLGRTFRPGKHSAGVGPRPSRPGRGLSRRSRLVLRVLAITGIVLVFLVFISGVALYVVLNGLSNPVHFVNLAEAVPGTRINVLVMGLDAPLDSHGRAVPEFNVHRASGSRTDTMMLVSVDPETKEVGILSLPRDSRVIIAGRENEGYDKLAHAHAYGGPDMTVATVSRLLHVPIHYYVRMNSAGAGKIVDLLGGVELYVERDMHYRDTAQNLYINLHEGLQVLNGQDAVGYLRFRGGGSDIDRIERQQKFLRALREELFRLGTITKIPSLVGQVMNLVDTNMTPADMLRFARMAVGMGGVEPKTGILPGDIRTVEDPGRPPLSYWVLHPDEVAQEVDRIVWGVDPQANSQITVEVQNGTTVSGLAAQFAEELRRQGYNVASVGDASRRDYQQTEIVDRSRNQDSLRRVSQAVLRYLPGAKLGRARAADGRAEFTVILGQDYAAFVSSGSDNTGS